MQAGIAHQYLRPTKQLCCKLVCTGPIILYKSLESLPSIFGEIGYEQITLNKLMQYPPIVFKAWFSLATQAQARSRKNDKF